MKKQIAPGVTREESGWGWLLTGTKEALIANGCAKADWFVTGEQHDKAGRVIRRKRQVVEGREVVTVLLPSGRAQVHISFTEDERRAAEEASNKQEEERKRRALLHEIRTCKSAECSQAAPPMDKADEQKLGSFMREQLLENTGRALEDIRRHASGAFHGWGIPRADLADLEEQLAAVLDQIECSQIYIVNARVWQKYRSEMKQWQDSRRVREAQNDSAYAGAFRRFLRDGVLSWPRPRSKARKRLQADANELYRSDGKPRE
jgi:hypothetical protein